MGILIKIILAVFCLVFLVLFLWGCIKFAIWSGLVESPEQTRERKELEKTKSSPLTHDEYQSLSPEGKLLHKMTEKQTQTEANTRAIAAMILGGAIGYLVFCYWPF
ncbi:hypothetical protein [Gimesia sp.]|uniref:hypothetical protein n=1 Tax=Gimesia sp. TaxID=2024833 RepID=UPI003A8F8FBB